MYQDPENAAFLNDVNQGRTPSELTEENVEETDVHLIDRSGEPYKPPPAKPFGGSGRSMREETGAAPPPPPTTAAALTVDEGAPTTTLQIRLADGSRQVVKANQAKQSKSRENHSKSHEKETAHSVLSRCHDPFCPYVTLR